MFKKYKLLILAAVIGGIGALAALSGTVYVMNETSDMEFCVSCHTMQPVYKEYQSSVHFSNASGVQAECKDCHIPSDPVGYAVAKVFAVKDLYHHFVTGKIDTPEQFESHRQQLAETVWAKMEKQDSQTCRNCHDFQDMDPYEQSTKAAAIHEKAELNGNTCIDCHKGIAHYLPKTKKDNSSLNSLVAASSQVHPTTSPVYTFQDVVANVGTIKPSVQLTVLETDDNARKVILDGYQIKGVDGVVYMAKGQRVILATLNEKAAENITYGESSMDEFGNEWVQVSLNAQIDAPIVPSLTPLWDYAKALNDNYCAACHSTIPATDFTANAWGPIAKEMGALTDITPEELEVLTKYFQNHASDSEK